MKGDIRSLRGQGSPSHYIGASPILKVGIAALSKGIGSEKTLDLALVSPSNKYVYEIDTTTDPNADKFFARSISYIYETTRGLYYYPNVHFVLKDTSTTPATVITNTNNLGNHDDPSQHNFDFTNAPVLRHPKIVSVETDTGGSLNGSYVYRVVFMDAADKETLPSREATVTSLSNAKVIITFEAEPYASIIRIYRSSDGGSSWSYHDVEQYASGSVVNQFTDDGSLTWTSGSLPTSHEAKKIPDPDLSGNEIQILYLENDLSQLQAKEYYRIEDVEAEHGYESEATNIARIMFQQGISSIIISPVPYKKWNDDYSSVLNPDYDDFIDAIDALDGEDIMFFGTTYYSNNILQYGLNKAELLSDKIEGQRERYFLYALKGHDNGIDTVEADALLSIVHSSNSNGKRVWLTMVDGGVATINSWINWDLTEGEDVRVYSTIDPTVDITPMILTFAAIAKYCAFNDPAESLTQKYITGFKLPASKNPVLVKTYTEQGYTVFTADSKVAAPYVDTAYLPSIVVSLEDGDLAISVTEDILDMRIRNFLKKFRGKKSLDKIIDTIKFQMQKYVLDDFVVKEWILEYDAGSIQVYRDPSKPDRIRGMFRYRPMYSITQLWVEHEFIV